MRLLIHGLNVALIMGLIVKLRFISLNIKVYGLIIMYNVYKHECNHVWAEMQNWSLNMCKRMLCDSNQV